MDSAKSHVAVPMPPGLHSVPAAASQAQAQEQALPLPAAAAGGGFQAPGPPSVSGMQSAREAAALREKNDRKQKCATCGNTARARCPYRQCRTCCMKNNKMCYIHGKTDSIAPNGSVMMATSYDPRYQAAGSMAMQHVSPQFRQPVAQNYGAVGAGMPMRYPNPSPGMTYGSQYYRPAIPGAQVPSSWSKGLAPGTSQVTPQTREQLEYMRLKSYRAAAQAMQKETHAFNLWRLRKLKEYKEMEAVLEDEAFDRYALSMSWLEEVFSVDAPGLEGLSEEGHLLAEGVLVANGASAVDGCAFAEGLRLRLATNSRKKEVSRLKLKRAIDRNLLKLKTREENVEPLVDDDEFNQPVMPAGRHAKRLKSQSKEGRDCIKRMDAFDFVLQKVDDIKTRDDICRSLDLYKDTFGPAIGCILPHLTQAAEDFLGVRLDSSNEPDWMDVDDDETAVKVEDLAHVDYASADRQDVGAEGDLHQVRDSTTIPVQVDGQNMASIGVAAVPLEHPCSGSKDPAEGINAIPETLGPSENPEQQSGAGSHMERHVVEEEMPLSAHVSSQEEGPVTDQEQQGAVIAQGNQTPVCTVAEGGVLDGRSGNLEQPGHIVIETPPTLAAVDMRVEDSVEQSQTAEQVSEGLASTALAQEQAAQVLGKEQVTGLKDDDGIVGMEEEGGAVADLGPSDVIRGNAISPPGQEESAAPERVQADQKTAAAADAPMEESGPAEKMEGSSDERQKPSSATQTVKKPETAEGLRAPLVVSVGRPRHEPNSLAPDSGRPQNGFPAICVCAWRRVDMTSQTAEKVLQHLSKLDGLEEL